MALRFGLILLVLAALGVIFGYPLVHSGPLDPNTLVQEFYASGLATLVGVALTVLILGSAYERRQTRREKSWLLRQVRSRDNELALEAIEAFRERGWLFSGALDGARLTGANLQGAYLWGASLRRTNLRGANLASALLNGARLQGAYLEGAYLPESILRQSNLQGAFLGDANLRDADLQGANLKDTLRLADAQLARTYRLRAAILSNGKRYDGRYRLPGDVEDMQAQNISPEDPVAVAHWYGVDPADYVAGQAWADERLEAVLKEKADKETPEFWRDDDEEDDSEAMATNVLT